MSTTLLAEIDHFDSACDRLQQAAALPRNDTALQQAFMNARLAYKTIEWATEYFDPATSRFVNGPPVPEGEVYSRTVYEPAGLQVLQGWMIPRVDTPTDGAFTRQTLLLHQQCALLRTHFQHVPMLDGQIFDALKLEVFRVVALGIAGFDEPSGRASLHESAVALRSVQQVLNDYLSDEQRSEKDKLFERAIDELDAQTDFNRFDRARFIRKFGNPLSHAISRWTTALYLPVPRYNRLLNQDAATLFDANAFNPNAYVPTLSAQATKEKIELGRRLFFDPVLSGNGSRSCATCHQPDKAFTDGLAKNTTLENHQLLARNTPTLINAALQAAQFYDARVNTLEDQSVAVIQNELEMHGSMELSVGKLWNDVSYRQAFARAFPVSSRTRIDTLEVMNALASFIRSLTKLNTRFDDYMRGNDRALTAAETKGFNLFMGKAKCGTCHYMPLFNGTFPPRYMKSESEVIGVPVRPGAHAIDPDSGRFKVLPFAWLMHAFKTPSLRNAELTAPYMHNGAYKTLEEVIDFYDQGGGVGSGVTLGNPTLPAERLKLTAEEKADLVLFIKTLTSKP